MLDRNDKVHRSQSQTIFTQIASAAVEAMDNCFCTNPLSRGHGACATGTGTEDRLKKTHTHRHKNKHVLQVQTRQQRKRKHSSRTLTFHGIGPVQESVSFAITQATLSAPTIPRPPPQHRREMSSLHSPVCCINPTPPPPPGLASCAKGWHAMVKNIRGWGVPLLIVYFAQGTSPFLQLWVTQAENSQ